MVKKNARRSSAKTTKSLYKKTILDNGIRVVTECLPYVRSVSLGIWADVGSRDESADRNGISHFLEHMVFKGTQKRSVRDIAQSLESLGGYLNAFTTKEQTCYYARVLDVHLPHAMDVLSDLILNATFLPKELEKEKQVVIEELHNSEDDAEDIIHDYFEKALFPGHSLGYPIIGTEANLRSFTREDLRNHVRRHYKPENLVVAAAGNLDHETLLRLTEKFFRGMKSEGGRDRIRFSPNGEARAGLNVYPKPIQQSHVCLGTVGYGLKHPRRYPLLVLNALLGEGMSSRLYQAIREKYGLAYSVYSFVTLLSDAGLFGVYIGTDPKNKSQCIDLVKQELHGLRKRSVPKAELERTKSQIKGNLMLGLESMSNRMMRLGSAEMQNEEFAPIDSVIKRIDKVSSEEVLQVAKDLFDVDQFSIVVVQPS